MKIYTGKERTFHVLPTISMAAEHHGRDLSFTWLKWYVQIYWHSSANVTREAGGWNKMAGDWRIVCGNCFAFYILPDITIHAYKYATGGDYLEIGFRWLYMMLGFIRDRHEERTGQSFGPISKLYAMPINDETAQHAGHIHDETSVWETMEGGEE